MPFLRYFEYVPWIQALGHFHPVGLSPWVQHSDHHLKRQLGYRCHQLTVHCAQACTPMFISSHLQESAEVMFLIGFCIARLPPRVSAYPEHTKLQTPRAYQWKSKSVIWKEASVACLMMSVRNQGLEMIIRN